VRALVTGGAGFIGSHVVEALIADAAAVTVVDNLSTGTLDNLSAVRNRVTVARLDIARDDIDGLLSGGSFDTIVHAAGNANIPTSVSNPQRDLEDNALATLRLLESIRRVSPGSRLVNISSATVYADTGGAPMAEDDPKGPVSPYGVSKLAGELYVANYAQIHGLRACNVRVFSVFGPRLRKQVVWDFMTRLAHDPNKLTIHGDGSERRNPTHVSNIVSSILLAARAAKMTGEAYNVGSRDSVSIAELARDIAAAMDVDPAIEVGQAQKGHARAWVADIGRIEAMGYQPKIGYHEGLRETVEWFYSLDGDNSPV
jgi:UDP-glucose 4-epimerase